MLAVELNEEKPLKLDEQIQRTRRLKIFVEPSICMKLSSQTTKHEQENYTFNHRPGQTILSSLDFEESFIMVPMKNN